MSAFRLILPTLLGFVALQLAAAQEPPSAASAAVQQASESPRPTSGAARRALIICGLPGDADHRKSFADSLELLYSGLTTGHGFAAADVYVLWGDEPAEKDPPAVQASRAVATRESIAKTVADLQSAMQPNDTLWVIVLGHAHYDGRYSWLNVAGDDLHQLDFGRMFEGIHCREQIFFITTPASGFYHKPLAMPGRIVVTATEPDLEVNETLYPQRLARALSGQVSYGEMEMDRDGHLSLFDLHLWIARDIAQEYVTGMLLATEHSLLDDNGDGRGTEVQIDYLSEELGGRLRASDEPPIRPQGEGSLARQTPLLYPPSPPVPPVEAAP